MSYLTSRPERSPAAKASLSEDLSTKRGLSAPSVPAVQLAAEEEELQMKKAPAQLAAEEEEVQMKKAPAQLAAEEEELQMKKAPAQLMEEEEALQGKFTAQLAAEEEEALQAKADPAQKKKSDPLPAQLKGSGSPSTAQLEEKPRANNTGLPDNLKSGIENLSGYSMDGVKVHYNSAKPAQLNAHAYAQGSEIHVASGQEKHLAHEAWHVVQQKQGRVKPTMQMKGSVPVNDDKGLETEADVMGARAMSAGESQSSAQLQDKELSGGSVQRKTIQRVETEEETYQRENGPMIDMISHAAVVIAKVPWQNIAAGEDNVETGTAIGGVVGSLTGLAGSATGSIQGTSDPKQNIAKAAGDITEGIGSSIGSLVKTITAIKKIYETANGKESKLVTGGELAIAMMEALKAGAEAATSIQKFIGGSVPGGIASMIPGLGLAIAACDIIKNAYAGYNSYKAENEMSGVSAEFKAELSTLLGGAPETAAPTLFANEKRGKFGNRITYLRLKPGLHEVIAAISDKGLSPDERTAKEGAFKAAHSIPPTVNILELATAIRSYEVGSKMQEINQKRKVQGARNIFTGLLSIAGEIAKFFPADGGITAGVLLGTSGAVGAAQSAGKFLQTMARDKGVLGGDKNRSSASKHKEYVNHTKAIYEMLSSIPQPVTKASDPKVSRGKQLVAATGANMNSVFKTDYSNDGSMVEQATYIIESMKTGR